ncbi:MAG: aspartate aminotransferase family protein [Lachnospiraceae bacterium]|nr:aspartate aminotransferase family protein [Lachnospiraceae bacterium]
MDTKTIIQEAEAALMKTYGRYQIVLEKGDGVHLYDTEGKEYLDFCAGIAVFSLGYNNKEYNDALKAQIDKLLHTSNYYYNEPATTAAMALKKATGMDRVFFTNSGTEAVEGAIKLARKHYYVKNGVADSEIIAMEHSFHGRSMGALSVTGTKKYRDAFEPLVGGVKWAEFNNIESVKAQITDKTAAIIMETVQGEGGIYPAEADFIKEVRNICTEKGIVFILDEIQCGMGRTGSMFAYQQFGIKPDIVTSAKALGCGVPVGAFCAVEEVACSIAPGDHGTTYGGNPFVCAAVTKVFELYEKLNVIDNVNKVGNYLWDKLEEVTAKYDFVVSHRGKGLMQGLELSVPVKDVVADVIDSGLMLISAGTNVIRFVPPLVITESDVNNMIDILTKVFDNVK